MLPAGNERPPIPPLVDDPAVAPPVSDATRPNKRAREDSDRFDARDGSPSSPLDTPLHLPKRIKRGRPTKAEAAERESLKAQIAAATPKPKLVVKLAVPFPPRLPGPSGAAGSMQGRLTPNSVKAVSGTIETVEMPLPSLVVKLPAAITPPEISPAPLDTGQSEIIPISPESRSQLGQESPNFVVKLPMLEHPALKSHLLVKPQPTLTNYFTPDEVERDPDEVMIPNLDGHFDEQET